MNSASPGSRHVDNTVSIAPMELAMAGNVSIAVPADLRCMTTFVILEQERWFENEIRFIGRYLKPGMRVLDIGANFGTYALPAAKAVGPDGQVVAFEPSDLPYTHLQASKALNGFSQLDLKKLAVGDSSGWGYMETGVSSELNRFTGTNARLDGNPNAVEVRMLDSEFAFLNWETIDFIKIDVEGLEEKVVGGGQHLFDTYSPLVMYEFAHDDERRDKRLQRVFESMGYASFRLMGDASCLVPVAEGEVIDGYTVNLFAAKPDLQRRLSDAGLLVADAVSHQLTQDEKDHAIRAYLGFPYVQAWGITELDVTTCSFGDALIAYAASRYAALPNDRRLAALRHAHETLSSHCTPTASTSLLATMVRVCLDLGQRQRAIDLIEIMIRRGNNEVAEPFFPPCERFDRVDPGGRESEWLVAAINERYLLGKSHSSIFRSDRIPEYDDLATLEWLAAGAFASPEIVRRAVLLGIVRGIPIKESLVAIQLHGDHLNESYWTTEGRNFLTELWARPAAR